ncbi:hypothetical protein E4U53_001527, partial [Claviceps sorghi]
IRGYFTSDDRSSAKAQVMKMTSSARPMPIWLEETFTQLKSNTGETQAYLIDRCILANSSVEVMETASSMHLIPRYSSFCLDN